MLFLVAPNNKCAGPLYELVFMLDTWLRRKKVRANVDITWSTYEQSYIQAFGPRLHEVVTREFERRVVAGHTEYAAEKVEDGEVRYSNGEVLPYDLLVAFSPYVAQVIYPTFPGDDRSFVQTDLATRQVEGHPDVYAVGDAGDFPVKQAFLAFLQADAAAEHLSARALARSQRSPSSQSSMCVMEQFDKATFAQVPLRLTGVPEKPIEVDPAATRRLQGGVLRGVAAGEEGAWLLPAVPVRARQPFPRWHPLEGDGAGSEGDERPDGQVEVR